MYVLVTLYLTTTDAVDTWLVYGHVAPGENVSMGRFTSRQEALNEAFQHGAPVMLGTSGSYDAVLAKLSAGASLTPEKWQFARCMTCGQPFAEETICWQCLRQSDNQE